MPPEIFIFLYGLGSILGFPIFIFWATMGLRRWADCHSMRDRYMLLCLESCLISLGLAISYSTRTFVGLRYGFSTAIVHGPSGVVLGIGLSLLALGMLLMVLVADMETHPPRWRWTKYAVAATLLWASLLFYLDWHDELVVPVAVTCPARC